MSRTDSTSNADAFAAIGSPGPVGRLDGRNVIVAVLDWGFDVFHPALRDERGRTRFLALVDQNKGRIYDTDRVAGLLRLGRKDRRLADAAYDPHARYFADGVDDWGAHGTAMMSIAAGSRVGPFVGLAPSADLIGIQLAHLDPDWQEIDAAGRPSWANWDPAVEPVWKGWRSYADSQAICDGLETAWQIADRRRYHNSALVILMALGNWCGPRDGRSAVDLKIADILSRHEKNERAPVTAVVMAAGNAAGLAGHWAATIEDGRPAEVRWRVDRRDARPKKLEVWYRSPTPPAVMLHVPFAGDHPLPPGLTRPLVAGGVRLAVAEHLPAARGQLGSVLISLDPAALPPPVEGDPALTLTLRLALPPGAAPARVHAWAERDDTSVTPATLAPACPQATLTSLATAPGALVVGMWDHRLGPDAPPDPISSRGPHPWLDGPPGQIPHIVAPGHRIVAARSKSQGFVPHTGTSAAAALAAGAVAIAMNAARRAKTAEEEREIRKAVVRQMAEGRGHAWCPSRGRGPIDMKSILREET